MVNLDNLLKSKNLRLTKQRSTILNLFLKSKKPINAQFIIDKLRKQMDPVTVYRNLDNLTDVGILKYVELGERAKFYEINHGDDHHHIMCIKCKYIEPIDICNNHDLDKTAKKFSKKFSQISGHVLEFKGVCKSCK